MLSFRLKSCLKVALCTVAFAGFSPPAVAAGLMSACEAEIAANCGDVSSGRGRISACLYAHGGKLSGACKTEVETITNSRAIKRNVPAGILSLQGSEYEAGLREACTSDANRLCSGVTTGKGRILSCLYSRSNKVSKSCAAEAKMVLDQLK